MALSFVWQQLGQVFLAVGIIYFSRKPATRIIAALLFALSVALILFFNKDNLLEVYSFVLLCVVLILERIFPREKTNFLSEESLKSMATFPLRVVCIAVAIKFYFFIYTSLSPYGFDLKATAPFWLQLVLFLMVSDLVMYGIHRLQHQHAGYWKWHKIHHSSTELSAVTNYRTNVLEVAFVQGGSKILVATILGISFETLVWGSFVAITISGALGHANLDFPQKKLRWLNYLIATPNYHALHHSKKTDRFNLGEIFPIFDIIFGTFKMPENGMRDFGSDDPEFARMSLVSQHAYPFSRSAKPVRRE